MKEITKKYWSDFKSAFISGSFRQKEDFDKVEAYLKKQGLSVTRMDKYWETQDEYDTSDWEKMDYLLVDLEFLARNDIAIFLPGWEKHNGCRLERKFAELSDTITVVDWRFGRR